MNESSVFRDFIFQLVESPRNWGLRNGKQIVFNDGAEFCPYIYVAHQQVKPITLGLSADEAAKIWDAADNQEGHNPHIRTLLLNACGLKEQQKKWWHLW